MGILRNLIVIEWYKAFFKSSFVLFLIITIANLIAGFLRGRVTTIEVIYNYLLELPNFISRVLPVACLTASLFSINKLKNSSELVAVFAAGFSRKKFVETIFLCSLAISLFQFLNNSFIRPYVLSNRDNLIQNPQNKFRNLQEQGLKSKTVDSGSVWYKGESYYVSFPFYHKAEKKLFDINIYYFSANHKLTRRIHADELTFNSENNMWVGKNVVDLQQIDDEKTFPVITKQENTAVPLREHPSDFDQIESDISILNIFKLKAYIDKMKEIDININDFVVIYLEKYTSFLICIIFALVACLGIFSPNRRGSSLGKNIFFIFIFTITYWLVSSYVLELGKSSQINAYTACFAVPAFFLLLLLIFYLKNRRLS